MGNDDGGAIASPAPSPSQQSGYGYDWNCLHFIITMEPITTALIVGFLADKVLGTAAEKYTETAIQKLNSLAETIWQRLRAKNPKAEKAIAAFEQQDLSVRGRLETYLHDEMEDDAEFKAVVEGFAQAVQSGVRQTQGGINQQVGQGKAVAIQSQNSGGTTHNTDSITINHNYTTPPGSGH